MEARVGHEPPQATEPGAHRLRRVQARAEGLRAAEDDARLVARAGHGYLTAVGARLQVVPAERGDL